MVTRSIFICGIVVFLILLSGCAKPKIETVYVDRVQTVKVPVAVYPEIKDINCGSNLPIKKLTDKSSIEQILEAYVKSVKIQNSCIKIYKNYLKELKEVNTESKKLNNKFENG